ncbi:VVA0879 family protein [Streptomyces sp. DSM 44917]|uniref:VVA0879 family protein n=1 Tax=Streptomyces boetiae TaxID=3075541 RepID=A0ABU2L5R4_9ACTN|nr:VVA0879 family protein [Streptomyces sp. DSM 44917]MDT0306837.1 VVA0879 family protein [Streptomyces sp. DSM 44917]
MSRAATGHRRLTQAELVALCRERFGDDPMLWAFRCPSCGDVATGQDMKDALAAHPRTGRDGQPVTASGILGQECIGRTLGALSTGTRRGCDWAAYGLLPGPWEIVLPDGRSAYSFPVADAPITGSAQ